MNLSHDFWIRIRFTNDLYVSQNEPFKLHCLCASSHTNILGRLMNGVDLTGLCLKSQKSLSDRVSTGSGSDLVSDQHAIFPNDS